MATAQEKVFLQIGYLTVRSLELEALVEDLTAKLESKENHTPERGMKIVVPDEVETLEAMRESDLPRRHGK